MDLAGDLAIDVDGGDVTITDDGANIATINATTISGSATSTGSFGKLQVPGNANVDGNITAGGTITAQEFHTEFVSASIVYTSGSTKFGDTSDDIHQFTGSIETSGSIILDTLGGNVSGSVVSTGSFGSVHTAGGAGIGTSSLEARLNVYHNTDNEWAGLFTQDHATGYGVKITGDMTGTDPLLKIMSENTNTRFRVQGDGKVGIGTNAPSVLLHVKGDTDTSNVVWGWIQNASTGTDADAGLAFTGGGNNFNIGVDATTDSFVIADTGAGVLASNQRFVIDTAGDITASGDIVAGGDVVAYYTSDIKLKDNVEVIQGSLNKIEGIRGVEFDWNDKAPVWAKERGHDVGVIAQEVQKVLPEVVQERTNGYLGVDYKRLIPLLIESVKELKQEVEDLKKKVN